MDNFPFAVTGRVKQIGSLFQDKQDCFKAPEVFICSSALFWQHSQQYVAEIIHLTTGKLLCIIKQPQLSSQESQYSDIKYMIKNRNIDTSEFLSA